MSGVDASGRPYAKTSYEDYQEFLLDRIAANYVSFTILEDEELDEYGANFNNMDETESQHSSYFDDTSNPFSLTKGGRDGKARAVMDP
jgi:hypothetical protein